MKSMCEYFVFLSGDGEYWCTAAGTLSTVNREWTRADWLSRMLQCEGFSPHESSLCKYFKEKKTICGHRRLRREARLIHQLEEL